VCFQRFTRVFAWFEPIFGVSAVLSLEIRLKTMRRDFLFFGCAG
jgi:hypothetical protein